MTEEQIRKLVFEKFWGVDPLVVFAIQRTENVVDYIIQDEDGVHWGLSISFGGGNWPTKEAAFDGQVSKIVRVDDFITYTTPLMREAIAYNQENDPLHNIPGPGQSETMGG